MCFQKCHCFASASLSGVKVKLNLEKSPHKSDYIQDIWIHPKQHQKRKKKILQKPESLDLQSCPVALKTNESPPVRKCQHFAGDLRQHTNFWDFNPCFDLNRVVPFLAWNVAQTWNLSNILHQSNFQCFNLT